MADAVLTTLCAICHTNPPLYKCPRDGAQTCSLACARRHKTWASCSGIREVTAYVPPSRLRTPAGIDHDYNLLHGIEVAAGRARREIVEERGLLTERDMDRGAAPGWAGQLRLANDDGARRGRGPRDVETMTVAAKRVRRACLAAGIDVEAAPDGMSRHLENATTCNRKTGRLTWQVEWLVYEDGPGANPTRILRKARDDEPIYSAFASTMEWVVKGQRDCAAAADDDSGDDKEGGPRLPRKKRRKRLADEDGSAQSSSSSIAPAWGALTDRCHPCQNPVTGAWAAECGSEATTWLRDADRDDKRRRFRYFLLRPRTKPRELIAVDDPAETLSALLPGKKIIEFPTIYVLPQPSSSTTQDLPPDHTMAPQDVKQEQALGKSSPTHHYENASSPGRNSIKRERPFSPPLPSARGDGTSEAADVVRRALLNGFAPHEGEPPSKKRKGLAAPLLVQEVDDGEIDSEGADIAIAPGDDDDTSSEGSSSDDEGGGDLGSSEDERHTDAAAAGGGLKLVGYDSSPSSDDGE